MRLILALTAIMAVSGCLQDPATQEYVAGSTVAGALLGYAATGDSEGAARGAAIGAAYGLAKAQRGSGQAGDVCYQYQGNQGAYAACRRGQERRARERQRALERQAYQRGKSY